MRSRSDLPPVDPQPWAALIPPDSFYARLAEVRDVLVDDDVYRPLYKDSAKGRPSLPPSLVVLTMLLQYHDDCSDRETEARVRFDLRWKHALGLALEDTGFDATVLAVFRRKLLQQGLDRALFERLVRAARDAGLLAKNAEQLIDSSHILGAAGVRDTYTLIRGGIRKLLRALGYTPTRRAELGERLGWYLDPDAPEKPELDWSDAEARREHLRTVVEDAQAALALVSAQEERAAIREAAGLLTKIVTDDIDEGPPGESKRRSHAEQKGEAETTSSSQDPDETDPGPRLRQGVARDRILSVVDPEMRWGHKSESQRWTGYKTHLAEEPESELITAIEVRPARRQPTPAWDETGKIVRCGSSGSRWRRAPPACCVLAASEVGEDESPIPFVLLAARCNCTSMRTSCKPPEPHRRRRSNGGPSATACARGPRWSGRSLRCSVVMACGEDGIEAGERPSSRQC